MKPSDLGRLGRLLERMTNAMREAGEGAEMVAAALQDFQVAAVKAVEACYSAAGCPYGQTVEGMWRWWQGERDLPGGSAPRITVLGVEAYALEATG